jgi:hypothetical protein
MSWSFWCSIVSGEMLFVFLILVELLTSCGNPGPSFEQAQTCVRVKPVNGIPNFPVYKQTIKTCIDSLPLKKTTITITKDNINMDCTIAGSDTKICSPTERFASQVHHDAFRKLKLLSMSKSAYLHHSREIDGLLHYANFCLVKINSCCYLVLLVVLYNL